MRQMLIFILIIGSANAIAPVQRTTEASRVDQLLDTPSLKGVASVRIQPATFIAVWTKTPQDQTLEIYEMQKYPTVRLINKFKDRDVPWQSLTAIQDGAVAGFQIRRTTGEGWLGTTLIYLYVEGQFKKVFESGNEAELFDLTGDGYPEVIEYEGDKGSRRAQVRISAWKNNQYHYVMMVPIDKLSSTETRKTIKQFLRSGE
jgi:hypothetical protein